MIASIKEIAYIIIPLSPFENEQTKFNEITNLVQSAGAEVAGSTTYTLREITPPTYVGSGKLEQIKVVLPDEVNLIVFDGELTPSQTLNIFSFFNDVKVIDRTTLILDIFALNAVSNEGKMQVELAQLKYIFPRLKGKGAALSRLGGGIGSRGPGESQLETDRRHIRSRINVLEKKLKDLSTRRAVQITRREKNTCTTVALVGYTNTGKSTLLNALTDAEVLVKDQLFATLDPTMRKITLKNTEAVLVDTVGFVKNIPHHIIEAFKSTLEFAVKSDLIINVAAANDDWNEQLQTTIDTLSTFANLPPMITVINKCDTITDFSLFPKDAVFISAKDKIGLEKLKEKINQKLFDGISVLSLNIEYENLNDFIKTAKIAENYNLDYGEQGVKAIVSVKKAYQDKFKRFLKKEV